MRIRNASTVLLLASALTGCITHPEKSQVTPKFEPIAEKNLSLAVLEARPDVISGARPPKFEGIYWSAFGPLPLVRPGGLESERFVDLLAGTIKDGLADGGANVMIVAMPLGATAEDALRKMGGTGAARHIVVEVLESNWSTITQVRSTSASATAPASYGIDKPKDRYRYDFAVYVAGGPGASKRFADQVEVEATREYIHPLDRSAIRYKQVLESIFADPVIRQALQ